MDFATYAFPAHWASYLINNDASGLDDDDIEEIDAYIKNKRKIFPRFEVVDVSGEVYFSRYHDFTRYHDADGSKPLLTAVIDFVVRVA